MTLEAAESRSTHRHPDFGTHCSIHTFGSMSAQSHRAFLATPRTHRHLRCRIRAVSIRLRDGSESAVQHTTHVPAWIWKFGVPEFRVFRGVNCDHFAMVADAAGLHLHSRWVRLGASRFWKFLRQVIIELCAFSGALRYDLLDERFCPDSFRRLSVSQSATPLPRNYCRKIHARV